MSFIKEQAKVFNTIQQFFDKYGSHGYLTPHACGELVKASRDFELKIVAQDVYIRTMEVMDSVCPATKAVTGECFDARTFRNDLWAYNLAKSLRDLSRIKLLLL